VKRVFFYLSALVGMGGMIYLAGAINAQAPAPAPAAPPPAASRPTVAVFNIVDVIRNYNFAKNHMALLNDKRTKMSAELIKWRKDYLEKQQQLQQAATPQIKDDLSKQLVELARKIEDKDREIAKVINEEGSKVIAQIHDHIKTVVDRIALPNGSHVVFAYPELTTPEEANRIENKEMKLRPPAAQPWYVAPQVDLTKMVVDTLNKWYEAPPLPPGVTVPDLTKPTPAPMGGVAPVAGSQPK
jgi:Skp family chaperone for outer membrane proteins